MRVCRGPVYDIISCFIIIVFCLLVEPHDFVGPTHGFDFADKSVSISSEAILLFFVRNHKKRWSQNTFSSFQDFFFPFNKAFFFIVILELLFILIPRMRV